MGKGGERAIESKPTKYTWDEVKEHTSPADAWIVHSNKVYDVSDWYVSFQVL